MDINNSNFFQVLNSKSDGVSTISDDLKLFIAITLLPPLCKNGGGILY